MQQLIPQIFAIAVLMLVAAFFAFRWGRSSGRVDSAPPDTVFIDRQLTVRDTIRTLDPVTVTVYQEVEKVRVDSVLVPVDFGVAGVIGASPVTIDHGNFVLTSFDPRGGRFVQQTYSVPPRKWGLSASATTTLTNAFNSLGLELEVRYENLSIAPRIGVMGSHTQDLSLFYGVTGKYRLFGR